MHRQPPEEKKHSCWGVELDIRRTRADVWFVSMSFRSLKEFGVSAERLGSICKRWMARVQRSVCVCDIAFTLVYLFDSLTFHNVVEIILCVCVPHIFCATVYTSCGVLVALLDPLWSSIVHWEWCFVLNVISPPRHTWMAVALASFLVPVPLHLSGNVCAVEFVWEWHLGVELVETGGYRFFVPKACLQRKRAQSSTSLNSAIALLLQDC